MSDTEHTPGPWKITPHGTERLEIRFHGKLIAICDTVHAPLIRSAPDLLAHCKAFVNIASRVCDNYYGHDELPGGDEIAEIQGLLVAASGAIAAAVSIDTGKDER